VTGQIDADQGSVVRQHVAKRAPQARRLSEPMQQHQGWTGPPQFNVEWHSE
jgi:hypothetical protein